MRLQSRCGCVLLALALLSFLAPHATGSLLRQTPSVVRHHAFATSAAQILALPLDQSAMHFATTIQRDQSNSFDAQGMGGERIREARTEIGREAMAGRTDSQPLAQLSSATLWSRP